MTKFLLDDEDFESKVVDMSDSLGKLQILKLDGGDYAIINLIDQQAYELGTFTKENLKALCDALNDTPINDLPRYLDYAQSIIKQACEFYKISVEELRTQRRGINYVRRRKLIMYVLHKYTNTSLMKIANLLNNKTHRLVIYHIRDVENLISDKTYGDFTYKYEYKELLNYLKLTKDDKKTTKTDGH